MMLFRGTIRIATCKVQRATGFICNRGFAAPTGVLLSAGNSRPSTQIHKVQIVKTHIAAPVLNERTELMRQHEVQQHNMEAMEEVMEEVSHEEPKDPIELAKETKRSGGVTFEGSKDETSLSKEQVKTSKEVNYFEDPSSSTKNAK